jgi:hypothetical protein
MVQVHTLTDCSMNWVGQNCIYTFYDRIFGDFSAKITVYVESWPELYMYTVYDCMYGIFLLKIIYTIYTYVCMVQPYLYNLPPYIWFWGTLSKIIM